MPSITFSFDDTIKDNYKLYGLMSEYQYKVIWFLDFRDKLLAERQIKKFKEKHIIGCHTISHRHLTKIPFNEACWEIRESRDRVHRLSGKKPINFVAPRGYLTDELKKMVFAYGFKQIRMTTINGSNVDGVINRTVHLYPRDDYGILTWEEIAEEQLERYGDVHIWGHVEEIIRYNYFNRLQEFLEKYKNYGEK